MLEDAVGSMEPSLTRPRAQAALAVLAVCGHLGCTRDRLRGLLWQERNEEQARHGLRDTLYAIRGALGSDALAGQGDSLRLQGSVVESDVGRFLEALREGRAEEAVDLYTGDLLEGFHLQGALEFQHWVDAERGRLLRERQRAVSGLARKAEREERWAAAADWWKRAVEMDPYNGRLVVRRMTALTRAGDRGNAVQEGEAHRALLATELDLEPDEAFLEVLATIRRGGGGPVQFFTPPPAGPAGDRG
jgi:DNA-binding SARP family transcriptional activator